MYMLSLLVHDLAERPAKVLRTIVHNIPHIGGQVAGVLVLSQCDRWDRLKCSDDVACSPQTLVGA